MTLQILLFSLLQFLISAGKSGDQQKATILFAGDAMQHQAQLDCARDLAKGKGYDFSGCYRYIAPIVSSADYAVCNLEVPLGGGPTYSGYPSFSAPDSFAEELKKAGFDLFLTANNHCLDRGDKAMRRTLTVLDRMGIDHCGTYHNSASRQKLVPLIKDVKGFKIAFLNYTYGTNGIPPRDGAEIAMIDRNRMAKEIKLARDKGAELVVVAIHWGVEYVLKQNSNQEALAQFLVDQGVDMIIGGHPHVVQPMMVVRNKREEKDVLLVYSLGNLISNMKTADTRGGAILLTEVERDHQGKARFKSAWYDTIFAAKPEGGSNYVVYPSWEEDKIPLAQRKHWELFNRGAMKVFKRYNKGVGKLPINMEK